MELNMAADLTESQKFYNRPPVTAQTQARLKINSTYDHKSLLNMRQRK
jgi:hypothetical protein